MTNTHSSKLKLLISAYACDPNAGSDQGVAWWWIMNCAKKYNVTVLTCEAQRPSIEKALTSIKMKIRFVYVKGPKRISPSGVEYKLERFRAYLWQLQAIKHIRRLDRFEKYDLAQHITIATWRLPSCLAFTSVPFIFGPVSGSEVLPRGFARHIGIRGFIWANIRSLLIKLAWCDPIVRFTLKRAKIILASSPITYNQLKARFPNKVEFYGHFFRYNELTQIKGNAQNTFSVNNFKRLVWVGQLIPRKGLDLLVRALADSRLSNCVIDIIGEGPEKARYKRLAWKLKVKDRVQFIGKLERSMVLKRMVEYDIFVFTSLQDAMGVALLEAMQLGLPCVVIDWSGPGFLVGDNGAAKVEVSTFDNTCKNLADILFRLFSDPMLCSELSKNAKKRSLYLTDPVKLDSKRDQIFSAVPNRPIASCRRS